MANLFFKKRRELLKFITSQSALVPISPLLTSPFYLGACTSFITKTDRIGLKPSSEDKLLLADGLHHHILCKMGEQINSQGDFFGSHNDFTCFIPLQNKSNEGLLWVNHESLHPELIHKKQKHELTRTKNEMAFEQKFVGGTILHISKNKDNQWKVKKNSSYNKRLDATTSIPFSHKVKIQKTHRATGTLANCGGGLTPWNSFLTCEENYADFYGEAYLYKGKRSVRYQPHKFAWYKHFPHPPEHYGWVVEVNPQSGQAKKLLKLGRFPHEGATAVTTRNLKQVVVYMGEDRPGGFIYKFVSTGLHFEEGILYAAQTTSGKWLPLDIEKSPKLAKSFPSQWDVLTYAHQAAEVLGATPQDRPEDIQVHPQTGEIFVALTNNPLTNNLYGSLLKISEQEGHDSLSFQSSTWMSGGLESGIACPDNLCFDRAGNLWVTCDISEKVMSTGTYKAFGNNGLFFIAMRGPHAGQPIQVASAPKDAELTGPWFSPDSKTLFLSVQHPGALTRRDIFKPTSTWPDGSGQMPRSTVVALQGPLLADLMA